MRRLCHPDTMACAYARVASAAASAAAVAAVWQTAFVAVQYSNLPGPARGLALLLPVGLFALTLGLITEAPVFWPGDESRARWRRALAVGVGAGVASTLVVYPHLFRHGRNYHPTDIVTDLAIRIAMMTAIAWVSSAALRFAGCRWDTQRLLRYVLAVAGFGVLCEVAYVVVPPFCADRFWQLHAQYRADEAARYAMIAATLQPTQANKMNYALSLYCVSTAEAHERARAVMLTVDWGGPAPLPSLAYNLRARGEAETGDLDNAARTAQAGLRTYPDDPQLWQMLGYVRCLQRRWPEAVEALDTAIRLYRSGSYPPATLLDAQGQLLLALRARGVPSENRSSPPNHSPAPPPK